MKQSRHASIAQGEKPPTQSGTTNALKILLKGTGSSGCHIGRIHVALRHPCTAAGWLCLFTATFLSETGKDLPDHYKKIRKKKKLQQLQPSVVLFNFLKTEAFISKYHILIYIYFYIYTLTGIK